MANKTTFKIREATVIDLEIVVRFNLMLAGRMKSHVNVQVMRNGVRRFLEDARHGKYFLAVEGNTAVGQIAIKPAIFEPWHNSYIIWVDDAIVDPHHHQKGVMKELLKHGITWAVQEQPEQVVRLYVSFTNSEALKIWSALGFEPIGMMMEQRQNYMF